MTHKASLVLLRAATAATPSIGVVGLALLVGLALMSAVIAIAVVAFVRPWTIGGGATVGSFVEVPAVRLWREFALLLIGRRSVVVITRIGVTAVVVVGGGKGLARLRH
jgi:hypothetical protein